MARLVRTPVTWLIYVQLGVWGYVLYGFGPTVALLRDEQHISRGIASLHSVMMAAGGLIGGAVFPILVRKYGRPTVMWVAMGALSLALAMFCAVRPLPATLAAALGIAVSGVVLVSGVVAGLAELHPLASHAAIAEANATACGIGAFAPLAVGAGVDAGVTWRPGMMAVIGLIGLIAAAAVVFRIRIPRAATVVAPPTGSRLPASYWLAWTAIALTGSVEVSLGLWGVEVLRGRDGMAAGTAASAVAVIVVGMFVGRLIGGRLALSVAPAQLLLVALSLSLCGFAVFWLATAPIPAVLGLFICGLGNAMHFPLSVGLAVEVAGPHLADRAAASSSYAMVVSFGIAPFALGATADRVGAHSAFLFVPLLLGGAAAVALGLRRSLRRALNGAVDPAAAPATQVAG